MDVRRYVADRHNCAQRRCRPFIGGQRCGQPTEFGLLHASQHGRSGRPWRAIHWSKNALPARDLSPRTIEINLWAANAITNLIGTRRLRTLEPADVEREFKQTKFSSESLIKMRSVLAKALDYGMRRKLVSSNIARHVELPVDAKRTEPGRAFTVDQAKALINATRGHRLNALWLTMLALGLRPGEATRLTWADIDLERNVIHVRRSLKLEGGHLTLTNDSRPVADDAHSPRRTSSQPLSANTATNRPLRVSKPEISGRTRTNSSSPPAKDTRSTRTTSATRSVTSPPTPASATGTHTNSATPQKAS